MIGNYRSLDGDDKDKLRDKDREHDRERDRHTHTQTHSHSHTHTQAHSHKRAANGESRDGGKDTENLKVVNSLLDAALELNGTLSSGCGIGRGADGGKEHKK